MVWHQSAFGQRRFPIFIYVKLKSMARTPSSMLALGTVAPNFELPDTQTNQVVQLSDIRGEQGTLIVFICNHCPFVIHLIEPLAQLANTYLKKGIGVAFISSNDVENYPQDGPEQMYDFGQEHQFEFPYLYDESQSVAQSYGAACTPDFYVFDPKDRLVYRGQFDDSRPGNEIPVSGKSVQEALENLIQGKSPLSNQHPSLGCNIKWKAENRPPDHY